MGRRTLLLIAALVVAALGTVLVWMYANNANKEAQAGQELVQVLVAKTKIEAGTSGATAQSNGAFEQVTLPQSAVTATDALSDAAPIANQVAIVPIFPGQQIISAQWGTTGQTSGLAIPKGKVAISVQLGDPQRVAGFVSPGSTVAIFVSGSASGTGAAAGPTAVKLLLKDITVLAVGPTTLVSAAAGATNANTEQIPAAIMTLAVTQQEAQKIIYSSGNANGATFSGMYFALMNEQSELVIGGNGTSSTNLFAPR